MIQKPLSSQSGFAVLEAVLILVVAGAIGFTGYYVYHSRHTEDKTASLTTTATSTQKNAKKTPASSEQDTRTVDPQTTTTAVQPSQMDFNFVPQTGWAQRRPTNNSFTASFGASETYGYCSDGAGILLISMIYADVDKTYECGGVKNIVSLQSSQPAMYTQVAIGPSETLWTKSAAQPVVVTLPQGEKASRYDYISVINGDTYRTIEYDISFQGKDYVAVNHWSISKFPNGPNVNINYFDTIVQKTLTFN